MAFSAQIIEKGNNMRYSEELIEEIRMKNDIVEVISGSVRLQRKGSSYFGLCPFHNEKSPSFSVSPAKQMYYCFGCGAGGNVITFLMQYENATFQEAVKMLADRAGVSLPEVEYSEEMRKKESRRAKLLEVNKEAAKYYYYLLRSPKGRTGYRYLAGRELSDDTMKKFGLGYADGAGSDLTAYLRSRGYADDLITESGLTAFDEKRGVHDKFWNRVMFPIQDANHRVIGFGGRVMGDAKPKYLNSPETAIFDKSRNLYGLNFARTARTGNIILCEGYMDVIAMHQAGFGQAVASLGTAFTVGQAGLLKRYAEEALLAYDSDGAGEGAALRAIGILKEAGLRARVIDMKPYKDPDEFMKNLGAEAFQERIDRAENGFFFELKILERNYRLEDPESKTAFHHEIAKKLCGFEEEVERENYIESVAERYHIGYENLRRLVSGYAARTGLVKPVERPKKTTGERPSTEDQSRKSQRILLTWLVEEPEVYQKISPYLSAADFTDELIRRVADKLFAGFSVEGFQPASIISTFEDEEEQREVAKIFNTRLPRLETIPEKEKALRDVLLSVKQNSFDHYSALMGADAEALQHVISGKKELEALQKTHISLGSG